MLLPSRRLGAQDESQLFDGDDADQSPKHQREHAEDVRRRRLDPVLAVEALSNGVGWTGPDVAVHHTERGQ